MEFKQYDVVRIKAIKKACQFEPDGTSLRAPRVGDVATILEIYVDPPGYELECSSANGVTEWLSAFAPSEVELEKVQA